MELPAILFSVRPQSPEHVKSILRPENLPALKQEQAGKLPLAYIVRNEDLAPLRKMKDIVVDRGAKHKAKGLAILLLGHEKIPLLAGSYTDAGQLTRSVRTLLANAAKAGERNIYIIGADEKIFDELHGRIEKTSGSGGSRKERQIIGDPAGAKPYMSLMALMTPCKVPDTLCGELIGVSDEIKFLRQLIVRAAAHSQPVLIMGETGSGKEIIARSIHEYSRRKKSGHFVTVNCGAIPSELLESELFGYMKGEFTGAARNKSGLWEEAQDGTLFLDEVGDLALRHQVKILRAMDDNPKIRRIGDDMHGRPVDARIIAATNRDLFSMVRAGRFREDLYYRLRGFSIHTFPLRNHPEDIPLLARHFWRRIAGDDAALPDTILAELAVYSWPGNVRELKFILSSLAAYCGMDHLEVKHLREIMRYHGHSAGEDKGPLSKWAFDLHQVECLRHLKQADEIVCAAKMALRSLLDRKPENDGDLTSAIAVLGQRLQDLDVLCLHPLRFNSEATFAAVARLKEKLAYFQNLVSTNRREAFVFWKTNLADEFKQVCSAIFDEVERLRK